MLALIALLVRFAMCSFVVAGVVVGAVAAVTAAVVYVSLATFSVIIERLVLLRCSFHAWAFVSRGESPFSSGRPV